MVFSEIDAARTSDAAPTARGGSAGRPARVNHPTRIAGLVALLLALVLAGCGTNRAALDDIVPQDGSNVVLLLSPADSEVDLVPAEAEAATVDANWSQVRSGDVRELHYRLEAGRYELLISKAGYEPVQREIVVEQAADAEDGQASEPQKLEVTLERVGTDPDGESPAPGSGPTAPPADEEQGTDPQPEEPGNDPQPVEPGAPVPGTTRAEFSLRGDPNFSKSDLTDEQRLWYERIWAAVRNPNANPDMDRLAASDELYYYARAVHSHVQALLVAFRATGDLELLDEVDRLAEIMRKELHDSWRDTMDGTDGRKDGHLNWVYRGTGGDVRDLNGKDTHEMNEVMTHAMVATIAYALELNRDLPSPGGRDYAAHADFWKEYLFEHFEPKWRKYNKVSRGLPFAEKQLMHAYLNGLKMHYYLYRLSGDESYLREAERQADVIWNRQMKTVSTSAGDAYVWAHGITSEGAKQDYLQATTYARYVMGDAVELHFEGFGRWADEKVMQEFARTFTELIVDRGGASGNDWFASDVGGGRGSKAGIPTNGKASRMSTSKFVASSYALISGWDRTGAAAKVSEDALRRSDDVNRASSVYVPVGLFLDSVIR